MKDELLFHGRSLLRKLPTNNTTAKLSAAGTKTVQCETAAATIKGLTAAANTNVFDGIGVELVDSAKVGGGDRVERPFRYR